MNSNEAVDISGIVVGLLLIGGAACSKSHQGYLILSKKSAAGVSCMSFWFSLVASLFLSMNIFVLEKKRWLKGEQPEGSLISHWVAMLQIFTGCLWPAIILGIMSLYDRSIQFAVTAFAGLNVSIFVVVLIIMSDYSRAFGEVYGLIAIPVSAIVWVPQIIVTVKTQSLGSLSWVLLVSELFGSMIVVLYQAVLEGEHWTTWSAEAVVVMEQVVLLGLFYWLRFRTKKITAKEDFELDEIAVNEDSDTISRSDLDFEPQDEIWLDEV